MTGSIDYQAVYADFVAKRVALDAAIEGIRVVASMSGISLEEAAPPPAMPASHASPGGARAPTPSASGDLAPDTFFGMSTSDAVRKYLGQVKRPQSPRAIADALRQGGQVHAIDEKVAYTNVSTALRRMALKGAAVQIKNGDWGLGEWYGSKPRPDAE